MHSLKPQTLATVIAFFAMPLLLLSCENDFQPLLENEELEYSIFGVLDLSADTNWVRIMPVRNSVERIKSETDIAVWLIQESTGEQFQMQDSLFELPNQNYVWNFYTDIPLQPSESYSIQVVTEGGEIVSATATIPSDFPTPEVLYNERTDLCQITVPNIVENLSVAAIEYSFRLPVENFGMPDTSDIFYHTVSYLNRIELVFDGYEFAVNEFPRIADEFDVSVNDMIDVNAEILVVSADTNWVKMGEESQLPGVNSNVSNGLGVLSGIVSKRLPMRPNVEDQLHMNFCPPLN